MTKPELKGHVGCCATFLLFVSNDNQLHQNQLKGDQNSQIRDNQIKTSNKVVYS